MVKIEKLINRPENECKHCCICVDSDDFECDTCNGYRYFLKSNYDD